MELKLIHEKPAADEPTDKRDEATKTWSNDDVQQPILFENMQLPQIENVQPPQIENVQPPRTENVQKPQIENVQISYLKLNICSYIVPRMDNIHQNLLNRCRSSTNGG